MRTSRRGLVDRRASVRDLRLIVIATEGTVTEKSYFEGLFNESGLFHSPHVTVKTLETPAEGDGSAPRHVLARLAAFQAGCDLGDGDGLWLMTDVDRWEPGDLKEVSQEAAQKGYGVTVSRPCFEFWLLLHFEEAPDAGDDCKPLKKRLQQYGAVNSRGVVKLAAFDEARVKLAVARARALHTNPEERWPAAPGSHVYKLVERLIQLGTGDPL